MARMKPRAIKRGDGFVTPRPQQDGTTRYQARWNDGVAWRARTFTTTDDAEDHLRGIGRAKRDGRYVPDSELTVAEMVTEYLHRGRNRWSPNTVATYITLTRHQIEPFVGRRRIVDLTPRMIQTWIDTLVDRDYSAAVIENARTVLSGACKEATRLGALRSNPVTGVRIPKRQSRPKASWTRAHVQRVTMVVRGHARNHAFYVVALSTGMRPGELRGLRWRDVDWTNALIQCRVTMTRDEHNQQVIGTTTKTGRSRTIAVPAHTLDVLRPYRAEQLARQLAHRDWHDTDLIFDRGDGRYMPVSTLEHVHLETIASANVPRIRLHDLRHTAATLMLEANINVKVVSEILGHASTATTLDIYQHVSIDLQRSAVERMSDLWQTEHA